MGKYAKPEVVQQLIGDQPQKPARNSHDKKSTMGNWIFSTHALVRLPHNFSCAWLHRGSNRK